MSKWGDLWKIIKAKVLTPSNVEKAGKAVYDASIKEAAKMRKPDPAPTADQYKSGLADPITLAVVAIVAGLLGGVFSSGVNTRSIVHRSQVTVKDSPGAVVHIEFGTNTVEVSGSGGVSIPVSGGR